MKNNFWKSAGLVAVIIAAFFAAIRCAELRDNAAARRNPGASGGDVVVTTTGVLRNVANRVEGYYFQVPVSWYVEPNGENVTFYPDYVPFGASTPSCKIEVSVFDVAGEIVLSDWVARHLSEDPTVVLRESSAESFLISGFPTVRWNGDIDGIGTTLVYAAAGSKIYEIAPSSLIETATSSAACVAYLDPLLQSLRL